MANEQEIIRTLFSHRLMNVVQKLTTSPLFDDEQHVREAEMLLGCICIYIQLAEKDQLVTDIDFFKKLNTTFSKLNKNHSIIAVIDKEIMSSRAEKEYLRYPVHNNISSITDVSNSMEQRKRYDKILKSIAITCRKNEFVKEYYTYINAVNYLIEASGSYAQELLNSEEKKTKFRKSILYRLFVSKNNRLSLNSDLERIYNLRKNIEECKNIIREYEK